MKHLPAAAAAQYLKALSARHIQHHGLKAAESKSTAVSRKRSHVHLHLYQQLHLVAYALRTPVLRSITLGGSGCLDRELHCSLAVSGELSLLLLPLSCKQVIMTNNGRNTAPLLPSGLSYTHESNWLTSWQQHCRKCNSCQAKHLSTHQGMKGMKARSSCIVVQPVMM
jgi:hypothetical protein